MARWPLAAGTHTATVYKTSHRAAAIPSRILGVYLKHDVY